MNATAGPVAPRISGPRDLSALGPLDPRLTAWRPDLADIALAGRVAVPHYAAPVLREVLHQAPLLAADRPDAVAVSELLPGETFALLDSGRAWGWGYAAADHYVGYVALSALGDGPPEEAETARIGPCDALLFAAPDLKAPVLAGLPAGARVVLGEAAPPFRHVAGGLCAGLWLHDRHRLPPEGDRGLDWVEVARRYLGAPYRWGGRTRSGIDCSGLVQMARTLAGHPCRRDSDMQAADFRQVPRDDARRGDCAVWPGHIGILLDADRLLHANAFWMECREEPLSVVEARTAAGGGPARARIHRP